MSISLNKDAANALMQKAVARAQSDANLPVEWAGHARAIFNLNEMTWTPAFGTVLLAKAMDERVDVLSLKSKSTPPNPFAYSARGLCHGVLVPMALEYGFSIRNTGREPLNNSPFGSASRIEEIERRALSPANFRYFRDVSIRASELSGQEAFEALAAFIREGLAIASAAKSVVIKTEGLSAEGVMVAVQDFLRGDARDRPRRLQAFAAACFDLLYAEVRSRRLNDPSRDFPGDVHAASGSSVLLALEVRAKAVSASDLVSFARSCHAAGVGRAVMFVDAEQPKGARHAADLDSLAAVQTQLLRSTQVAVFTSAPQLLTAALLWSNFSYEPSLKAFPKRFLERLREIEVSALTLQEWSRAVAVATRR